MTKQNIIIWIVLMGLTVIAGLISRSALPYVVPILMTFAALKFIGVARHFMEMEKAHVVWKMILMSYIIIFVLIILALI